MGCSKKRVHFSAIFSLFGVISPHIPIGDAAKRVLHHLIIHFYFHGESQSNIQNSYVSPYYPNFSQAFFEKREGARENGLLLSVFASEKKRKLLSLQYE